VHATTIVKQPIGQLVVRYEQHSGAIYIDRKALKRYLSERQIDYAPMKNLLMSKGVLKDADKRKVLGAGTTFSGGQVDTWWIDANHPDLADTVAAIAGA